MLRGSMSRSRRSTRREGARADPGALPRGDLPLGRFAGISRRTMQRATHVAAERPPRRLERLDEPYGNCRACRHSERPERSHGKGYGRRRVRCDRRSPGRWHGKSLGEAAEGGRSGTGPRLEFATSGANGRRYVECAGLLYDDGRQWVLPRMEHRSEQQQRFRYVRWGWPRVAGRNKQKHVLEMRLSNLSRRDGSSKEKDLCADQIMRASMCWIRIHWSGLSCFIRDLGAGYSDG